MLWWFSVELAEFPVFEKIPLTSWNGSKLQGDIGFILESLAILLFRYKENWFLPIQLSLLASVLSVFFSIAIDIEHDQFW